MVATAEETARYESGKYDGVLEQLSSAAKRSGSPYVMWDLDNEDEILTAKHAFEEMVAKGAKVFVQSDDPELDGKRLESFDAEVEHMQVVPRIAGG